MNLIIEQGNTRLKVAVFDGNQQVAFMSNDDGKPLAIDELYYKYYPDKCIVSSVVDKNEQLENLLKKLFPCYIRLDETTPVPVSIEYATPDTLGNDRIAAAVGANYLKPEQNILVIDAGTAITYELIEKNGIYKGGNISPGLSTRFLSLNCFTRKLPLVTRQADVPLIGTSTESAILAGVVNGIVFEMDGYIDVMKAKYGDIFVFLTGGHAFYFENRLKNHIFAAANLVLTGLNRILEYNAEKN